MTKYISTADASQMLNDVLENGTQFQEGETFRSLRMNDNKVIVAILYDKNARHRVTGFVEFSPRYADGFCEFILADPLEC